MKNVVFYFHGYNSSANTDKVEKLKNAGFDVYAWDIDIDPVKAQNVLINNIFDTMFDYIKVHQDVKFWFVGTSLGAYHAAELGDVFNVETILVNPAYNPSKLLPKIGCDEEIAKLYTDIIFNDNDNVIIAKNDELIDFSVDGLFDNAKSIVYSETGGHRFNGEEFNIVINMIDGSFYK